jgi:hypothetical protein
MQLSRALVAWYFRAAWFVTLPAALIAVAFAVGYGDPLADAPFRAGLFVFFHSVLIARTMSRFDTPATAFLVTRGFSRDRLWLHRIAAHLLCVLAVWGPASLLVWLGVRSAFQNFILQNPYYPLFASADYVVPLWWLVGYLLLMGVVQYGPVRRAQPTCDRDAGYAITVGVFLAAFTLLNMGLRSPWFATLTWLALIAASVTLLYGSWRLHRQVEIQP